MAKRNPFTTSNFFWQCGVALKTHIREKTGLFSSEEREIALTFFSDKIFTDKESAALFFPKFIKDLIEDGTLPKDVIDDGNINEDLLQTFVRQVTVAAISPDRIEYEGKNDIPL